MVIIELSRQCTVGDRRVRRRNVCASDAVELSTDAVNSISDLFPVLDQPPGRGRPIGRLCKRT
ncbi:hypothetical protein RBA19_21680, partial [Mycobacteroides abscessus subsp. massiliense]